MLSLNRQRLVGSAINKGSINNSNNTKMSASTFSSSTNIVGHDFSTSILEGFLPKNNPLVLHNMYREIYLMDPVSGPAVDLMSTLPWSPFTLSGIDDVKAMSIYEKSVAELGITNLMTQLSVSYLVLGIVVGTFLFDDKDGIFTDLLVHNPDYIELTPIPLRGYDPKIDLKLDDNLKKFLRSKDPRDVEALKEIPQDLFNKLRSGSKISLEPLNTLFLERSLVPGVDRVSYYSRILPIWLIEKALTRGTIIGAWRRQRSILHIQAGTEDWEPSDEQLEALSGLFQNADQDPQGAIVVTRPGIETNEIRNGGDFWRVTEDADGFSNTKMKALGISEGFLSGDTSYNSADVALSVFIENLRAFRDFMTRNVLYDKIFLTTAKYHGIKKRTEAEIKHNVRLSANSSKGKSELDGSAHLKRQEALKAYTQGRVSITGAKNIAEAAKYMIPTVTWQKELKASSDQTLFDMLKSAEEKGIPIPLAYYASAAGVNVHEVLSSLEEDISIRKEIKNYTDNMKKEGLNKSSEDGNSGSDSDMFASVLGKSVKNNIQNGKFTKKNTLMKAACEVLKHTPPDFPITEDSISSLISYASKMVNDNSGRGKKNRNPSSMLLS